MSAAAVAACVVGAGAELPQHRGLSEGLRNVLQDIPGSCRTKPMVYHQVAPRLNKKGERELEKTHMYCVQKKIINEKDNHMNIHILIMRTFSKTFKHSNGLFW